MSFQVGIVGLPNVGKSTLFKALTRKSVLIENYPFATIEPNIGIVEVPDERLEKLAQICASAKIIPTTIKFVDIAGLVKNAYQGEGLGNQFLANIREVDAIIQTVRAFKNPNIIHVTTEINPLSDAELINVELAMADLTTVEKRLTALKPKVKTLPDKILTEQVGCLEKLLQHLNQGLPIRQLKLNEVEQIFVKSLSLLTAKPLLYVINADEGASDTFAELKPSITISAKLEAELADLPSDEAGKLSLELGLTETGLDKLIHASYQLLDLITFFTSGPQESRAWTIKRGTKAPQAAGVIHTDFEHGFIRAEVISYDDFVASGGEAGARGAGKLRLEGKDYIVQDGDVCYFRFSV